MQAIVMFAVAANLAFVTAGLMASLSGGTCKPNA
jgi:hypothetical protein